MHVNGGALHSALPHMSVVHAMELIEGDRDRLLWLEVVDSTGSHEKTMELCSG